MGRNSLKRRLLIIDDDKTFCATAKDFLAGEGREVLTAHTGAKGLELCSRLNVDVVLLDQKLPDGDGRELCAPILSRDGQTKIIFVTAYPSFDNAVEAIKAGAYDYLTKPFELGELKHSVEQAFRTLDLEGFKQLESYKSGKDRTETVLVGEEAGLAQTARLVNLAASSDAPVLITGETGTGKNVIAKAIHYRSSGRTPAFMSINCAALPENLIEAELFGYEKGAFTGAAGPRKGIFEMAQGGTLLLDEIGDMPLHLQSKLLSVLEDGVIKRLGAESVRQVDVRIIAATNSDLEAAVRAKGFREDLYYRLSVIRVHVPPLRERAHDVPELCRHIIRKAQKGRSAVIPDDEMKKLMAYRWPGNVRELKNIIERALILQTGPAINPSELLAASCEQHTPAGPAAADDISTLYELEKNHILYALEKNSGNITKTAKVLGASLSTIKRKLRDYGVKPSRPN